jgi:hypothetical protein
MKVRRYGGLVDNPEMSRVGWNGAAKYDVSFLNLAPIVHLQTGVLNGNVVVIVD